jgi:hypothetical protein
MINFVTMLARKSASLLERYGFPATEIDFPWREYRFAVATKAGLFLCTPHSSRRVMDGHFYGMTFAGRTLLIFEALPRIRRGRVIAIDDMGRCSIILRGLSHGCHQIEFWNGSLYVVDSYNNRILRFAGGDWRPTGTFHPLGRLDRGRASANYAHMNSLLFRGGRAFIICHNETQKTGRVSEILICDLEFNILERRALEAGNAHNIAFLDGMPVICDSAGGTVTDGRRCYAKYACFTRGLAIAPDMIAVGESEYGNREKRPELSGWIDFHRRDWSLIARLPLPGMVQEIRALFAPDLGLSAYND